MFVYFLAFKAYYVFSFITFSFCSVILLVVFRLRVLQGVPTCACFCMYRQPRRMHMHTTSLRMQANVCARMPLPRNPNSIFCIFFFDYFT